MYVISVCKCASKYACSLCRFAFRCVCMCAYTVCNLRRSACGAGEEARWPLSYFVAVLRSVVILCVQLRSSSAIFTSNGHLIRRPVDLLLARPPSPPVCASFHYTKTNAASILHIYTEQKRTLRAALAANKTRLSTDISVVAAKRQPSVLHQENASCEGLG